MPPLAHARPCHTDRSHRIRQSYPRLTLIFKVATTKQQLHPRPLDLLHPDYMNAIVLTARPSISNMDLNDYIVK